VKRQTHRFYKQLYFNFIHNTPSGIGSKAGGIEINLKRIKSFGSRLISVLRAKKCLQERTPDAQNFDRRGRRTLNTIIIKFLHPFNLLEIYVVSFAQAMWLLIMCCNNCGIALENEN